MLVSTRDLFDHCYGTYAIAAVNVEFMEQVIALFRAGQEARAPFIVQTTPLARDYAHPEMLIAMIRAAARMYPNAVFAVHLDHGNEVHVEQAVQSGAYNSVMIDASHDRLQENIRRTSAVVGLAHEHGISVEAELGVLSGVEDHISVDDKNALYTDPGEVERFVRETHCDSLAIAVGTSHGAYKFSGGEGIRFDILSEIQKRLPRFPLVLHGGSAVNISEIERINRAGGKLKASAKGVDPDELVQAIQYGVCKVNIATDLRLLWTRVNREFFRDQPEVFAPLEPGRAYMNELERFITQKFELLNADGKSDAF
jgi:fructose-bisphosphate aldolase class II